MALSQLFWDVLMPWNLKSTYFSLKIIHFLSLNIWYVIYVLFWIKYWNLKLPHHCILFLFTICTVSQLFWNRVCISPWVHIGYTSLHCILHIDVTVDSRHVVLLHFSRNFAEIHKCDHAFFLFGRYRPKQNFLFLHWPKCINWHCCLAKCSSFLVVSSTFFLKAEFFATFSLYTSLSLVLKHVYCHLMHCCTPRTHVPVSDTLFTEVSAWFSEDRRERVCNSRKRACSTTETQPQVCYLLINVNTHCKQACVVSAAPTEL